MISTSLVELEYLLKPGKLPNNAEASKFAGCAFHDSKTYKEQNSTLERIERKAVILRITTI